VGSPLEHLREAVERGASGELICATRRSEVHVHVQKGRVAWATDSERPYAFTRHLVEHGRVTREELQEVLKECRRTRSPLGESLVSWGLATADQVRDALRHQIRIALETLVRNPDARALFLERSYSDYDPALTFDFAVLLGAVRAGTEGKPANGGAAVSTEGLLDRFRQAITEAHWLERLEGEALVERYPPGPARSGVPGAVLRHTLLDGADFVALRAAGYTLLGASFPAPPSSVWINLAEDGAFGSAYSEVTNLLGLRERGDAAGALAPASDALAQGAGWAPLRELPWSQFMASAPEALAVFVTGGNPPVAGIARSERVGGAALALVRRRTPAFAAVEPGAPERRLPRPLREPGAAPRRLVTGEQGLWCFASELEGAGTLWLAADRACPQGLGWAYLTSLTRTAAIAAGERGGA
jgi:hypothetical protein